MKCNSILDGLLGGRCLRGQALSMEQKPLPETRAEDAEGKHLEAWDTRPAVQRISVAD